MATVGEVLSEETCSLHFKEQKRTLLSTSTRPIGAYPLIGLVASSCHLSRLVELPSQFRLLQIVDLSNNYIKDISPLASCMSAVWFDLHGNHIESLPDEYFWSGLVSLRLLHLHNNPIGDIANVKYLASAPNLEALTMYDTPVSLHQHYRHCCVNMISTLKALDLYLVSDEEVVEGLTIRSDRHGRSSAAGRVDLMLSLNGVDASTTLCIVLAKLASINRVMSKFSSTLFVQRIYRGHYARRQISREYGRRFAMKIAMPVVNPPSSRTQTEESAYRRIVPDVPQNSRQGLRPFGEKMSAGDSTAHVLAQLATRVPSLFINQSDTEVERAYKHRFAAAKVSRKIIQSNMRATLEAIMDAVKSRRIDQWTEHCIRDILRLIVTSADGTSKLSAEEISDTDSSIFESLSYRELLTMLLQEQEGTPSLPPTVLENNDESLEVLVPSSIGRIVDELPADFSLRHRVVRQEPGTLKEALMEIRRQEAVYVRDADFFYHTKQHSDMESALDRIAEKDRRLVDLNVVDDRVKVLNDLSQKLACLTAVDRAYADRSKRHRTLNKMQFVSDMKIALETKLDLNRNAVVADRTATGIEGRTERYKMHCAVDERKKKDLEEISTEQEKRRRQKELRTKRRTDREMIGKLGQRLSAIATSINKYDFENRCKGHQSSARALTERVQHATAVGRQNIEDTLERRSRTAAINGQIEKRRIQDTVDAVNKDQLSVAKIRVEKIRYEAPSRLPPLLPGPASHVVGANQHAIYTLPHISGPPRAPALRTAASRLTATRGSSIGPIIFEEGTFVDGDQSADITAHNPTLTEMQDRWRTQIGIPAGWVGVHAVAAELS